MSNAIVLQSSTIQMKSLLPKKVTNPPRWAIDLLFQRNSGCCESCGRQWQRSENTLLGWNAHHIGGRHEPLAHLPENMALLCHFPCHDVSGKEKAVHGTNVELRARLKHERALRWELVNQALLGEGIVIEWLHSRKVRPSLTDVQSKARLAVKARSKERYRTRYANQLQAFKDRHEGLTPLQVKQQWQRQVKARKNVKKGKEEAF